MTINLATILTEAQNPHTLGIDTLPTLALVTLMNQEDQGVITAIEQSRAAIASAIDLAYVALSQGGRLIYMGAGTSGRLGVLDASECLPTFGVGEEGIIGLIAGGDQALRHPVEAAEDNGAAAIEDLTRINLQAQDIVCALAASGRTPYCLSAVAHAKTLGAQTLCIVCSTNSPLAALVDQAIVLAVGPEVIMGSTRMKSGSAQKMVLNMLSTGVMIKLGKVYGNLMVDVKPTNAKLVARAQRMIMQVTQCTSERAQTLLKASGNHVKTAIIMELCGLAPVAAHDLLQVHGGRIAQALHGHKTQFPAHTKE